MHVVTATLRLVTAYVVIPQDMKKFNILVQRLYRLTENISGKFI
jgi:hypothetical protein